MDNFLYSNMSIMLGQICVLYEEVRNEFVVVGAGGLPFAEVGLFLG